MSDATNWVTIKIPEPVRDAAREDDRTYGDIMQDGLDDSGQNSRTHEILSDVGADPEEIAAEVWANAEYGRIAEETASEVERRLR